MLQDCAPRLHFRRSYSPGMGRTGEWRSTRQALPDAPAQVMKLPLILTAFIAMASTAHAECLSSASAVWNAHPGSHATWRLRLPGHEGEKCWFAAHAGASRDAAHEIMPPSATAVPLPRPRSLDTLAADERGPLPAVATPTSAGEARSILIWGKPLELDPMWETLFTARDRGAQ